MKLITQRGQLILLLTCVGILVVIFYFVLVFNVEAGVAEDEQFCQSRGLWVANSVLGPGACVDLNGELHTFEDIPEARYAKN